MSYIILAINPGSTSTKIAVYEDTQPVLSLAINHSAAEIAAFATIGDQFEWRKDLVLESAPSLPSSAAAGWCIPSRAGSTR